EVSSLIANAGEGISQAIGLGGRDLSDAVSGAMALRALDLLDADVDTDVLCIVGKPPGPATTKRLAERVRTLRKPCVVHFAGATGSDFRHSAATLEDAALAAVALARGTKPVPVEFADGGEARRLARAAAAGLASGRRFVRGVYAGGTLAYEAVSIL